MATHRNYDYYGNNRYDYGSGGASKSSIDDYLERVTRMQRMPSVATDIPEVPNAYSAVNHHNKTPHVKHQNLAPETHKKVHIVEHEKVIDVGRDGKREVYEDDKAIDVEVDGFIEQKHKNFEMSKWDTLKAY